MSVFETVKIKWNEKEYEVPSNRVMGLIERIEDHLSFSDLSGKDPKIGKISRAYAEALRYAGARVSDEEVYSEMFNGATGEQIQNAISGLLLIMIPPEHLQKKTEAGTIETPQEPKSSEIVEN